MGEKIKRYGLWMFFGVLAVLGLLPIDSTAQVKKSHEYGEVVLDKMVKNKGQMPVVFRHWNHRAKHSCRLCHVDIEFEMAGETEIMEEDNKDGRYCGTCHNGKESFDISECSKCHPKDTNDAKEKERRAKRAFFEFKKNMPNANYGNKIDWNQAEAAGTIVVKDYIEGVTFDSENKVSNLRDEPIAPKLPGLPGIIFSHKLHVAWNGCGMCHPEPFALETGKTEMSMKEITEGKFCGICHGSVAFPLNDCNNCHSTPVSQ
nr:hypothetical protein [Desulfobulbaceae bacterium]